MDRREYLLSLVGAAGAAAGGYFLLSSGNSGGNRVQPQAVEIVTESGTDSRQVPAGNGLTLIDIFSTYCSGCKEQIDAIEPIYRSSELSPTILSLTTQTINESFTHDDLRSYWETSGGPWPVGVDEGSLAGAIGADRLPTVAILDEEGVVHWVASGASTDEIREKLRATTT